MGAEKVRKPFPNPPFPPPFFNSSHKSPHPQLYSHCSLSSTPLNASHIPFTPIFIPFPSFQNAGPAAKAQARSTKIFHRVHSFDSPPTTDHGVRNGDCEAGMRCWVSRKVVEGPSFFIGGMVFLFFFHRFADSIHSFSVRVSSIVFSNIQGVECRVSCFSSIQYQVLCFVLWFEYRTLSIAFVLAAACVGVCGFFILLHASLASRKINLRAHPILLLLSGSVEGNEVVF